MEPENRIVHTATRDFALVADTISGVTTRLEKYIVAPGKIVLGMQFLAGVMELENGMMLVPDLVNAPTPILFLF